ncbi:MAG: cytochrome-c oxidase, cbb3-type subunit III, partial [Rhodospirillaceae bacterium]
MAQKEKDPVTGVETTGHTWDGIKELNNPVPRWWLYIFYVCCAWALVYWILYPAWPLGTFHTTGLLGWSQRVELEQKIVDARKSQSVYTDRIAASSLEQIRSTPDLLNFALAGGKAVFGDNCVACHGAGAQGRPGFPNLADDKWIWGGKLADIYTTIKHGIRAVDDSETRPGVAMPAWSTDQAPAKLSASQIDDVAEYVLSLNKGATDQAAAGRGAATFAENCVACHAEKGQGNQDMGAPALNDGIWLYGGDKKTLVQTISNGRAGV